MLEIPCLESVARRSVVFVRLASVHEKIFSYSFLLYKKLYTLSTFNAIFENNVAFNCTTVQQKRVHSHETY
jgi:hypothetical protein